MKLKTNTHYFAQHVLSKHELYNLFLQLEQDVHRIVHHVVKACTGYLKSCTTCSINLKFMFKVLYNMLCLEKMCTNLYNMFLKF